MLNECADVTRTKTVMMMMMMRVKRWEVKRPFPLSVWHNRVLLQQQEEDQVFCLKHVFMQSGGFKVGVWTMLTLHRQADNNIWWETYETQKSRGINEVFADGGGSQCFLTLSIRWSKLHHLLQSQSFLLLFIKYWLCFLLECKHQAVSI